MQHNLCRQRKINIALQATIVVWIHSMIRKSIHQSWYKVRCEGYDQALFGYFYKINK